MGHRHRHRHSRHADDRREDGKILDEPDKLPKGKRKKHHIHKAERKAKRQHSESLSSKHHRDKRSGKDTHKRAKVDKKKPLKESHWNKKRKSSDSDDFSRSKSESSQRSSHNSSSDESLGRSRKRSRGMMELVTLDNTKDSYKGGYTSTLEDCKKIDKCDTKGGSTHDAHSDHNSRNSKGQSDCKAEELEVELRHKALANLLRHRDSSCKSDEQRNSSSWAMEGTSSRQGLKCLDSDVDDHRWAFGSDAVLADTKGQPKNNVEDNELVTRGKESSTEEGEICLSDAAAQDLKTGDSMEAMSNLSPDIASGIKMDSKKSLVKGELVGMDTVVGSSRQQSQRNVGNANNHGCSSAQPARSHEMKEELSKKVEACCNITHSQPRQLHINPDQVGKGANLLGGEATQKEAVEPEVHRAGVEMSVQGSGTHAQPKEEDKAPLFQEKTMSVVRGGEVVQVNYKVYIPKRATELAKRRLRR